jgi:hypothetical protein
MGLPADFARRAPMVAILAWYTGSIETGEKVVRPFKQFGSPVADLIQPMPYVMSQSLIDQSLAAVIGETSSRR